MKLIKEVIQRRLETGKDFELNNENFKALWTYYQIYNICLNILGKKDPELKKKYKLLVLLIKNPDNLNILNKLKNHYAIDSNIIEIAFNSLEENQEITEVMHDFYPPFIFGVDIDDRQ